MLSLRGEFSQIESIDSQRYFVPVGPDERDPEFSFDRVLFGEFRPEHFLDVLLGSTVVDLRAGLVPDRRLFLGSYQMVVGRRDI